MEPEPLRRFANEQRLDIVGQVIEGQRFKTTGLDSAAWACLQNPEKCVYLGEAMEWRGEAFVGVARMRLTGDLLWKMEGYLYPEMLFINPRALAAWPDGMERALIAHGESEQGIRFGLDNDQFVPYFEPPVDLQTGPGGDLFYVDNIGGTVRRVRYSAGNTAPQAVVRASPTSGLAPTASAESTASAGRMALPPLPAMALPSASTQPRW